MRSMMLASFLLLSAALALGLGACNNTTPPRLYAQMSWKMRCPNPASLPSDCSMGCTEGMDRFIDSFTGENGTSITCSVTETADQRILNFRFQHVNGYAVQFQNVAVPLNGGSALTGTVRFREDNEYQGLAGAVAPSTSQPCQVSNVEFFRDEMSGDPTIRGHVLCQTMRSDANRMLCRGLSASGGAGTLTSPSEFVIFGCPGLVLPAP